MGTKSAYVGKSAETIIRYNNAVFFTKIAGASCVQRAAWDSDITYSHASALLAEWERLELLNHMKKGRSNKYEYTEKGVLIRDSCFVLLALGVKNGGA
jgi:hypothetical protein